MSPSTHRGLGLGARGDTLRETLHNGEEATEVVHSNGEVHSVWFKAVIND